MIDISTAIIQLALLAVPISWLLPTRYALDGVAAWTLLVLAAFAPVSALWLLAIATLTPFVLRLSERTGKRGLVAALWCALLLAGFATSRLMPGIQWIGVGFFTLRHIHVVGEWWMERIAAPGLKQHLRYQLFLPVMVVGPIHRIENFERQCARRRWDAAEFLSGMERLLTGTFMAIVIGGSLMLRVTDKLDRATVGANSFLRGWIASALDWVSLYFVFAGLTSIALGTSLMIGLRLEENFNRPWQSRSLIDFWTRWHMSLSSWVLDYVFRPVMALSRNAMLGLAAAMLAIGLWHEFSAYYVLWSCWQVLGVVLARSASRLLPFVRMPEALRAILAPLAILAWLSLARPVIVGLLEFAT